MNHFQGNDVLKRLGDTLSRWGMPCPTVPDHLVPGLRSDDPEGVFTWSDGSDVPEIAGYAIGMFDERRHTLADYLTDAEPDYFVCGGKDNGYSALWGFLVRAGGMLVWVRVPIRNSEGLPSMTAAIISAFNTNVAPLLNGAPRPLTCAAILGLDEPRILIRAETSAGFEVESEKDFEGGERTPGWVRVIGYVRPGEQSRGSAAVMAQVEAVLAFQSEVDRVANESHFAKSKLEEESVPIKPSAEPEPPSSTSSSMTEPPNDQWWPANPVGALSSPALAYAVLGPTATIELRALVAAARERGINVGESVSRLEEQLGQFDGRPPAHLFALGLAMASVLDGLGFEVPEALTETHSYWDVYKHLGSATIEAIERFGFTRATFEEYLIECRHRGVWDTPWPPAGAAYTRHRPG